MNSQIKGSAFIILSALFFATYGIWSKLMAGHFGEFSQAWTRGLILAILLFIFGIVTRKFRQIKKVDLKWFLAIWLCGSLNQAPYFYGFEHLPVGTATLLFYMMLTLGTFILGKVFFNEKITKIKLAALAIAVIGLFIIYQFSLSASQILPALGILIAGFMGGTFVTLSKKLSTNYSEVQILFGNFALMFLINFLISILVREPTTSVTLNISWLAQLGYIIAMVTANIAVVTGFKNLEPSVAGLLGLLEVILAALFGIVIFKDLITTQLLVGGTLILVGSALPDLKNLLHSKNSHKKNCLP